MPAALEVRQIAKSFPGVRALRDVSLDLEPGEIHGLVGENGAGKSTLLHILGGVFPPDAGEIRVGGKAVRLRRPHDAVAAGIGVVYQELSLLPNLSIAENIFAHRLPRRLGGLIDWRRLAADTREVMAILGESLPPSGLVGRLGMGKQQVVEILKVLSRRPCIILLDEPTASLSQVETDRLFEHLRRLRAQRYAILFISHHLNEVFAICDRVTVLRDGALVGTRPIEGLTEPALIGMMIGRAVQDIYGARPRAAVGPPRLSVRGLTHAPFFRDVSCEVRPGEIVGVAGLVGSGRTELAHALFGMTAPDSGEVVLDGQAVRLRSPAQAIRHGLAYLTEDRKTDGLFLRLSIRENLAAPVLPRLARRGGLIDGAAMARQARALREQFGIVTPSVENRVANLSGGNQQKVLFGMWAGTSPRVLIADEPTRGVDVGSKIEIYRHMRRLCGAGTAIVMISSDLQEVLGLSDRVLVMREGRMVGEIEGSRATEHDVLTLALSG